MEEGNLTPDFIYSSKFSDTSAPFTALGMGVMDNRVYCDLLYGADTEMKSPKKTLKDIVIILYERHRTKKIICLYQGWLRGKVLDVGCGIGIVTNALSKHFNLEIVGADINDYRRVKTFPFVLFKDRLPFPDEFFDVAMFNCTLHHILDQRRVVDEAMRVAKEVIAYEIEPSFPMFVYERHINRYYYKCNEVIVNFKTMDEWGEMLKGYSVEFRKRSLFNFAFRVRR